MILGAEGFLALAERLQNALWAAGGGPREHRGDRLSAAFRKLAKDAHEDLTGRYDPLYADSARQPTRNNRGIAHENRAVESPHGHLKNAVPDATLLRGTSDFDDLAAHRPSLARWSAITTPAMPNASRPNARTAGLAGTATASLTRPHHVWVSGVAEGAWRKPQWKITVTCCRREHPPSKNP